MLLQHLDNRATNGYTTFSSVWEKGEIMNSFFILKNEAGEEVPVQTRVTAWWPDGSIKWASHTADSKKMGKTVMLDAARADKKDGIFLQGMIANEDAVHYFVQTEKISMLIPKCTEEGCDYIARDILVEDKPLIQKAYPVLYLEKNGQIEDSKEEFRRYKEYQNYNAVIHSVEIEENGPLQLVFCFKGMHRNGKNKEEIMPFHIRMYVGREDTQIRFVHTFFYDGKEEEHFLKGMGIRFDSTLTGRPYQRHVKFATDRNYFHEAAVLLNCNYPRLQPFVLAQQMAGSLDKYAPDSDVEEAVNILPVWNRYFICQDSPTHFSIRKQTREECCLLNCMHGYRAPGAMSVTGENGGFLIGIKDFWEKYPTGLEALGLNDEITSCTAWFYSPEAEAYDFRHYDNRSYPMSSYEGFEEVGASAYGIAVTSECCITLMKEVPADEEMEEFVKRVRKPSVYVAKPEYYKEKKAFGYWSLIRKDTEVEAWIEDQLELAFDFYKEEIENRSWYGLFDYGDFMHTYDAVRHCWKYDMGGFAWQNTELVPTYWLWLYFLRTGREDVFTVAEAMSRHCSEVDFYHFGPMKGIGSRHNVRHWGCSCKEPRVSMAGHHRFYYYLTGDFRMGDVLKDVKDADKSMLNLSHHKIKEDEKLALVRSGPDWSSFVSNWMTEYERTLDINYRKKIETGIEDISNTPLGLTSGPDFEYDPENSHLIYKGEYEKAGNMHLQVCMGGPEIWFEMADMLELEPFKDMLAAHGRFYYLSKEEKERESQGLIINRPFAFPYFAAALAAYSAQRNGDEELAGKVWKELLHALATDQITEGFRSYVYAGTNEGRQLKEIPWIKTNFTAQWCLNSIVVLDLIREYLPKHLEEMSDFLSGMESGEFRKA